VDVVEGHGTGTALGDPIEAQALLAVYGQGRPDAQPLWLGSVKSNIGHAQAAAGVAGVIKMVLAMRHGVLPASLHAQVPSSKVDWGAGAVRVLSRAQPWPDRGRPRRAGVSSFGVSGTNVHVILEQSPDLPGPDPDPDRDVGPVPVVFSARTPEALREYAGKLAVTAAGQGARLTDVAWSLVAGRAVLEERAVVLAADRDEAAAGLAVVRDAQPGDVVPGVVRGRAGAGGRTVLVFPGQGAQWAGMGAGLLAQSPVFAQAVADCAQALEGLVDWPLAEVLSGAGGPGLDRVDVVQPASFAMVIALARVWQQLGVAPDAVLGHSQGEIAAACIAGVLTLPEAIRVVVLRSRLIAARLAGLGGMVSVPVSPAQVAGMLADGLDEIKVAAVNGPSHVVVAGPAMMLETLLARCDKAGIRARSIPVDYPSHTREVDRIRDDLATALDGVHPRSPELPWFSTVDARWVDGKPDTGYWFRNLRQQVRFADAVTALTAEGFRYWVETSPHPVLTPAIEDTAAASGADVVVTGTLARGHGGAGRLLESAARLWTQGHPLTWAALFDGTAARRVDLPAYPFQRKRYWLVSGISPVEVTHTMTIEQNANTNATLADRLSGLPGPEQEAALIDLVIAEATIARGDGGAEKITHASPFFDIGFNSLTAVELRNRLNEATGLRLPPMLAFDYPTPELLASHLHSQIVPGTGKVA
jgi:acyl transferase domain-containing protein